MYPTTIKEILAESVKPAIVVDQDAVITYINQAFQAAYGWSESELRGQSLTIIMPSHMRDAHNTGFSRFLITESPRILNKPLELPISCKDGTVINAELFIIGEKQDGVWRFAATINGSQGI